VFDETLVPRPDVLEQLASQKTNVEGGDLKRSERHVVFMTFPNMSQVLAPGGLIGGAAKEERRGGSDGGEEGRGPDERGRGARGGRAGSSGGERRRAGRRAGRRGRRDGASLRRRGIRGSTENLHCGGRFPLATQWKLSKMGDKE
jgi:hypothetical protein